MIGDFLFAWLSGDAGVTALIQGSDGIVRACPGEAPELWAFPHLTFEEITGGPKMRVGGVGDLATSRVQIDCWGRGKRGYTDARALAAAIVGTRAAPRLNGYRGTAGGIRVQAAWLEPGGRRDSFTGPQDGSDDTIQQVSLSFAFAYEEP